MVALTQAGTESLDRLVVWNTFAYLILSFSLLVLIGTSCRKPNDPGLCVSVDQELYFKAGGYNVVNNPQSGEVNEDSTFWICSQGKLIVHLAALQLIEHGKLSLESPVSEYIPEFANLVVLDDQMADVLTYKPAKKIMRVKHILNFTSGLFYPMKNLQLDHQPEPYAASHDKQNPISRFLSIIQGDLPGIPLVFEPGENFAYGWSSDIVGFVIEKASGQSLETYLQENIFKPLSMRASFYRTPDIRGRLVDLSYRRGDKLEAWANQSTLIEQDPSKVACHMGGVGLYASEKDYLGLLRHLLQIRAGTASNPIIRADTLQSIFEPALPEAGVKSLTFFGQYADPFMTGDIQWGTALALTTADFPGRRKKGSAFWSGWAHTFFFIDPSTGVAAIFATQLIPTADQETFKLYAEFEKTLYAGLS